MTARVVGVLTEALAQHHVVYGPFGAQCQFGDWHEAADSDDWAAEFAEHQASVVAALPNIAVVPLPEPDQLGNWKVDGTDLRVRNTWRDEACIELEMESVRAPARLTKMYEISVAPDLAAVLLAAARAAGGQA